MKKFVVALTDFSKKEEGASTVEYAILVSLIAMAVIATVVLVGIKVESLYNRLCTGLGNGTC